ncbi:MAG: DUF2254 domain-containing protein, partial [Phaeodactylibacter sp.]|nr:DUF2254 domain-containing protein [Phaeodactylibacter sp.]
CLYCRAMERLYYIWNNLKSTFWFVPVFIMLGAMLAALVFLRIDGLVELEPEGIGKFLFVRSIDSARSVLSTISGAMISVAGVVFSVTLVALTLASNQFGPRLIKNFMYVRLNQVVLGTYIASYIYCLIVLNTIQDVDGPSFIPSLSILLALVMAVANIVLLIIFIHHIAVSIQADKVIADIYEAVSKHVEVLFPEKIGEGVADTDAWDLSTEKSSYSHCTVLTAGKSGYLQFINGETLLRQVSDADALLELDYRPGGFLIEGLEIGRLYSHETPDQQLMKHLQHQFLVGNTRSSQQDIEFSIHQMVEIAVRALSPGINDPYTAIAVIDNLTATMSYLAQVRFPSPYRSDEAGTLRIAADTIHFEGVLDAAFNQIRQYSGGCVATIIRLMEALTTIDQFTADPKADAAVLKHAQMVLNLGKGTIQEPVDLRDLEVRAARILKD